jgi:CRISPR-associated protein Cmr2
VQKFISQARKAQDLYCGSYLLSYLTAQAVYELIERYGPTSVIYPDLLYQPLIDLYLEKIISIENSQKQKAQIPSLPNRFVAIVPETEPERLKELGNALKNRVKGCWMQIVEDVLKNFSLNSGLISQAQDFPVIYWAAVPWRRGDRDVDLDDIKDLFCLDVMDNWRKLQDFAREKGEHSPNIGFFYQLLYSATEKTLASRKNLRDFEQKKEYGRKCSICGEKEAKIGSNKIGIGRFMSESERLCALCFTKRGLERYMKPKIPKFPSFPSTAEVALSDFKERALNFKEKPLARDEFNEYVKRFKEIVGEERFQVVSPLSKIEYLIENTENLEGEWFYEDNLTQKAFQKYMGVFVSEDELAGLKERLKRLTDKVGTPNPYFAVIMVDGDNMGKWLSGELLPEIQYAYNSDVWTKLPQEFKRELPQKKLLTPAIHSSISTALRSYSTFFVPKIVEEDHIGKVIYAGGDDVLCFVNLKDLFSVLRSLRACFSGNVRLENEKIIIDWGENSGFVEDGNEIILTMGNSATTSAGAVIAHYKMPLRMVLKKANEMLKRAKDGDKDSFAISLWKHSGEERKAVFKWRYDGMDVLELMDKLSMDFASISDKFLYTLRSEFTRLKVNGRFEGTPGVFNTELKRLLNRASGNVWFDVLKELFWKSGAELDNFVHLLEIASFMRRQR